MAQNDALFVRIDNGIHLVLSGNSHLVFKGDTLEFLDGAENDFQDKTENHLSFAGNLVNPPSTFNGSLDFIGSERQEISDNISSSKITIANPKGVEFSGRFEVYDRMTFTEGRIFTTLHNNLLTGFNTEVIGADDSSFVDGPMTIKSKSGRGKHSLFFPIGKEDRYKPATIFLSQEDESSFAYKGEVFLTGRPKLDFPKNLEENDLEGYWKFSNGNISNVDSMVIELRVETDDGITNSKLVHIARADTNDSIWESLGGKDIDNVHNDNVRSELSFTELGFFIIAQDFPLSFDQEILPNYIYTDISESPDSNTAIISFNDTSFFKEAFFLYKGISDNIWEKRNTDIDKKNQKISFTLSADSDPIGLAYYFQLIDTDNNEQNTDTTYAHVMHNNGLDYSIQTGHRKSSYNVVSFPLDSKTHNGKVSEVFSSLGDYSKRRWRLFSYLESEFTELKNPNDVIEPGKGYLLASRKVGNFNSGLGTTVLVTQDEPFEIQLKPGWNLIGNPYLFEIFWDDILENQSGISSDIYGYSKNWDIEESRKIPPLEGRLICVTEELSLKISALKNPNAKRKTNPLIPVTHPLDNNHWEIHLKLESKEVDRLYPGLGMHPQAKFSFDQYDILNPPSLGEILDIHFIDPEFSLATFGRNIVPTSQSHIWNFHVETNQKDKLITMSWQNDYFGKNNLELILFDQSTQKRIDMRKTNRYLFNPKKSRNFQVYFGNSEFIEENLKPSQIHFGDPYPNPFSKKITLPFSLPVSSENYQVEISIFDLKGKLIYTLVQGEFSGGVHQSVWNGQDHNGKPLPNGFYIVRLIVKTKYTHKVLTNRLVLQK